MKADSINIPIPDFHDYESVYQFWYEYHIDKAYDQNTYQKHYQPNQAKRIKN